MLIKLNVKMKAYGNRKAVEKLINRIDAVFANVKKSSLIPNDYSMGVHCFLELDPTVIRNVPIECPLLKKESRK